MKFTHRFAATSFVFSILLSSFSTAQDKAHENSSETEVPGIMAPMREEILELQPFLVSPSRFAAPSNRESIKGSLKNLNEYAAQVPQHSRLQTPGFAVSADVLKEQLKIAEDVFNKGSPELARKYVQSSLKACSSCHSQVGQKQGPLWEFPQDRVSGNLREQGDFWYTIRHYSRALQSYQAAISSFPEQKIGLEDVNAALEKSLAIFLRVRRSGGKAIGFLQNAAKNPKLPDATQTRIQVWIQELKDFDFIGAPSSREKDPAQLIQYASQQLKEAQKSSLNRLDDSQLIRFLYVSGLLYEFINFHPERANAQILYWLATADEWLQEQFYFSLSNLYLKECVKRYPTDPFAKTCFKELKEKVELEFTGSSGLNLPAEVKQELDELEKLIAAKK